jgi:hypothetical protein
VYGTGVDLPMTINKKFLSPGTNEVSMQATIKGCPAVTLSNKATIQVVSAAPAIPALPSGPATVCQGDSNQIYSVPLDPNVLSYTWTLPAGAATTSTGNIASVTFGNSSGAITVQANNVCGTSTSSAPLNVQFFPAAVGGNIIRTFSVDTSILHLQNFTGNIIQWESSANPGIWDIVYNTDSLLSVPPVAAITTFRAQVQSGSCGIVYSTEFTVTPIMAPVINSVTVQDNTNCKNPNGEIVINALSNGGPLQYSVDKVSWIDRKSVV